MSLAPFVKVYTDDRTQLYAKVTRFEYTDSEMASDASYITIEEIDVDIIDDPNLQEGKAIYVNWGYVGGVTNNKKLYIFDIKPEFTNEGVRLSLECYAKAAYLKMNTQDEIYQDFNIEEVMEDIADKNGLDFRKELEAREREKNNALYDEHYVGERSPNIYTPRGVIHAQDRTAVPKLYAFKRQAEYPTANKSEEKVIKELIDEDHVENLVFKGTEDTLLLRKRNLDQKPYKKFVYKSEPGNLLEFTPASKSSVFKKAGTSVKWSAWDPEKKEYNEGTVDAEQTNEAVLGDLVELPSDKIKGGLSKYNKTESHPNGRKFNFYIDDGSRASVYSPTGVTAATDATAVRVGLRLLPTSMRDNLDTTEQTKDDAVAKANNRRGQSSLSLYSSAARVLGDPELQSGKVISILKVSIKYSGNYYISSVRHELGSNGYLCYLELLSNSYNNSADQLANKVDASQLNLNKNKSTEVTPENQLEIPEIDATE